MPDEQSARPLKVCSTCGYWTKKYKGFCRRLEQGAGRFHICEDWTAPAQADLPLDAHPEAAEAGGR